MALKMPPARAYRQVMRSGFPLLCCCVTLTLALLAPAIAQEVQPRLPRLNLAQPPEQPSVPQGAPPPAQSGLGRITLAAQLVADGPEITRGLVWRIFDSEPGPDGKLQLVASGRGGTQSFDLIPGTYLVHASFGRAGATKRVTIGDASRREAFVLDAGGLMLNAENAGGNRVPPDKLRFSIYEGQAGANGDRALIVPDVTPQTVVRLNAGTYHVVSTYGNVNAVVRSDIKVEAGKLVQATVEHRAAEVTMKLVREAGGEAMADTSWSIQTSAGDPVRESIGAYATMVLAEGDYTVVARNRDHIFQRDVTVVAGENAEVEVIADESAPSAAEGAD